MQSAPQRAPAMESPLRRVFETHISLPTKVVKIDEAKARLAQTCVDVSEQAARRHRRRELHFDMADESLRQNSRRIGEHGRAAPGHRSLSKSTWTSGRMSSSRIEENSRVLTVSREPRPSRPNWPASLRFEGNIDEVGSYRLT